MEGAKGKLMMIAALFSAVVFFIGAIFFFTNPFELSNTQLFILGCLTVLIGAMSASYKYAHQWAVSFGIIALGCYLLLRGTGLISLPWLSWAIGLAFAAAAAVLCYIVGHELDRKA